MAKRKRLSPAQPTYLSTAPESKSALGGPGSLSAPPIAQVASEAATEGALQELTAVLETARAKGLMIEEIALDAIDETHLVRDRLEQDEEEMGALVGSLRARGQQTPIEVVALGRTADGKTHGLISGWRRLRAMRRLYAESNDSAFATIKALVIQPDGAEGAYVAMVEENEIRVNLSHYERARIAVRALREGVYSSQKYALQSLFANATRAKRSKIGSFVTLVEALDEDLLFPTAIREKLGLGLARAFAHTPGFADEVVAALRATARPTAEAEQEVLSQLLAAYEGTEIPVPAGDQAAPVVPASEPASDSAEQPAPAPRVRSLDPADRIGADERVSVQAAAGVRLGFTPGQQRIELTGTAVDMTLMEDLKAWLRRR
ncbi:ParB/RepB/Spo0J family partition protein [Phaeobacter gallaeciensis]|uniref:Plasmid partitioning protein ParB n=1 Tax=Phaeobacter gallaeciensis TaxID=60890 RepID=A0AAC9ZCV9_9RHOB|nr:ParB N-terminal domain-containing protein [Phaeobacter gallaeciensis]AHD12070.1 plasmid partitioning protein parB [Phaeobacter gallaeciensis DSM 26640]ATE95255.1 plasmid partitioning protein ParB [Phaeobacter gallaeciensis]ATE99646.1 plasmid partitioning protein ParB [Phaeobacter gallaeciensis]ATF03960.1 plasmid partitioning protein ParB [Phaeobacter gallaeciensis]ATF08236.1 plasmid partitioning protein ParB [Phaeobacter gallaeciensis]